jgi:hypothetical protein
MGVYCYMYVEKFLGSCGHIKKDGTKCGAQRIRGSQYCFFHEPSKAAERLEARRRGGRISRPNTLPPETPDISAKTAEEVVDLLSLTINQVRRGEIDSKIAQAIGYLAGMVLRAKEQGEVEKRLLELEELVAKGGSHIAIPFRANA